MSKLKLDKEVLQGRRPDRLQDTDDIQVSAPLRDQIVSKLTKRLEDMEFAQKIVEVWHRENAARVVWLQRQQLYLSNWDEFIPSSADGPFVGSSNLHMPIAFTVCKTFHARMLQTLVGVDPPFNIKARRADALEKAQLVEELMSYTLKEWINDRRGVEETLDTFVWDWVTTGAGILKTGWEITYEKFLDIETEIIQGAPLFDVDDQGNEISMPQFERREKEVERLKEKFRGPTLDHIRPEDFVMAGGEGNPDRADVVIHRQYLTADKLWTLADQKIFRPASVKAVIKGGSDRMESGENSGIKMQRAHNAGQAELDTDSDLDRYEILETYASLDVDGSGINSEIIVWVHLRSREILRATYLHRVNKAGKRPFAKIDFHKRPGQPFGMGLVEILHPLTTEIDAMHNLRIDYGMFSTMPFFFYRPNGNMNPEEIQLRPGMGIPLDNPQSDVFFPNLGNRTIFGFQEEAALQTMIERLTGISDLSLGVLSGQQGATRTATGARALIGEANANLDVHLRRLNRGWKKVLESLLHLLQQRMPPGFEFRVTGEDGDDYFAQIDTPSEIAGDFDFEISANSANSNQAVQQNQADGVLQQSLNPLMLQLGIVSPGNLYEAIKNWYQSRGIKEWSRFINKPPEDASVQLTPEEELQRVLRGSEVKVNPTMDHQGFLDLWQNIKEDNEKMDQFDEQAAIRAEGQAQQHQQMISALEQAQAQSQNVQQQQVNAAQSQLQAPVGLNPLQGGGQ